MQCFKQITKYFYICIGLHQKLVLFLSLEDLILFNFTKKIVFDCIVKNYYISTHWKKGSKIAVFLLLIPNIEDKRK